MDGKKITQAHSKPGEAGELYKYHSKDSSIARVLKTRSLTSCPASSGTLFWETSCDIEEGWLRACQAGLCVNSGWVFLQPLSTYQRSLWPWFDTYAGSAQ